MTTNEKLDQMWARQKAKPTNETEALMMAAPGEYVAAPTEHPLADVIAGLLGEMDDTSREIIQMKLLADMSVREIAEALGLSKSDVHRRVQALTDRLAEMFENSPEIKEYLNGH